MLRRDIFNIFLKGTAMDTQTVGAPEPVLHLSDYYKKDDTVPVCYEWKGIQHQKHFSADLSFAYPFTLTLDITNAAEMLIKFNTSITIGINDNGCLYIGQITDKRILSEDKLTEGIQLVLEVNPLKNGMSHAKLKAIDRSGLTLSLLKSTLIKTAEWTGDIELSTSKYNALRIEGYKSI